MRKFTALIVLFLLCGVQLAFAQRTITGTVTHADDGSIIPGATIRVQGTTLGTVTDLDGKYEISVPDEATTMIFSFVGMVTQEVAIEGTVINVALEADMMDIQGVVVTALGISREKKALGYAVQNVDGEALSKARDNNPLGQLAGKVAGVQISGSSGNMGGSNRILIRGANSVTGENQPLFVIDGVPMDNSNFNSVDTERGGGGIDYGNMMNDINPDDIESMSILKGPSAAALYGSRGANGVIMITTKKGPKGKKGIGVSVNTGVAFETVGLLPTYQTSYGGGYGFSEVEIDGQTRLVPDYHVDESWGPKYEGQSVVHWHNIADWEDAGKPAGGLTESPWVTPENDVDAFFETGVTYTNNIALTGADDNGSFRLSYTNMTSDGYMPNSSMDKNTVNFSGTQNLGKKLHANAVVTYVRTEATGRAYTGYDDNNVMQKFTQWGQRQLDMEQLQNYEFLDGTQRTWNRLGWDNPLPNYSNNPYWTVYKNFTTDSRDRVFGNVGLMYDITDFLKLKGTIYNDFYTFRNSERIAIHSQETPFYSEGLRQFQELNYEAMLMFDKQLNEDFSLKVNAGANVRTTSYFRNIAETSGGLNIANEPFRLSNSVDPIVIDDYNRVKQVNSLFANASIGWKYLLYLDVTGRNDWSSTLPSDNWSYFYPSVTGTFVFSELAGLQDADWLSFGKVRAGWASVGNDTDPYNLIETYTNYAPNFNGVPRYSVPNSLPNPELLPERTNSWEVGTEMSFLDNRLGIDFTYYNMVTNDLITSIDITAATGYTSQWINAGKMANDGIELMLSGTPVRNSNFEWNIAFNFAKNNNELLELHEDIENYRLVNGPFKVTVNASVGQPYGVLMGSDFIYDDNGNKLVNTSGRWQKTSSVNEVLGSVMPNYNLGIINNFKIFGLDLGCVIDIQNGGSYFSTSYMWGMYSGMLEETVWCDYYEDLDVTPLHPELEDIRAYGDDDQNGVILNGVYGYWDSENEVAVYTDAEGNVVDSPVANETAIPDWLFGADYYYRPDAQEVFDASYIKLRELTLGYTLPKKMTGPINNLRIAAYGRNLMIWGLDNPHFDPESAITGSGNIQGIEGAALPSMRNFGINLSFNF